MFHLHLGGGAGEGAGGGVVVLSAEDLPQPGGHVQIADDDILLILEQRSQMAFHDVRRELQIQPRGQGAVGFGRVHDPVTGDAAGPRQHGRRFVHHPFDGFLVGGDGLLAVPQDGLQQIAALCSLIFTDRAQQQPFAAGERRPGGLALEAHAEAFTGHVLAHGLFDKFLGLVRFRPAAAAGRTNLDDSGREFAEVFPLVEKILRKDEFQRAFSDAALDHVIGLDQDEPGPGRPGDTQGFAFVNLMPDEDPMQVIGGEPKVAGGDADPFRDERQECVLGLQFPDDHSIRQTAVADRSRRAADLIGIASVCCSAGQRCHRAGEVLSLAEGFMNVAPHGFCRTILFPYRVGRGTGAGSIGPGGRRAWNS